MSNLQVRAEGSELHTQKEPKNTYFITSAPLWQLYLQIWIVVNLWECVTLLGNSTRAALCREMQTISHVTLVSISAVPYLEFQCISALPPNTKRGTKTLDIDINFHRSSLGLLSAPDKGQASSFANLWVSAPTLFTVRVSRWSWPGRTSGTCGYKRAASHPINSSLSYV